MSIFPKLEVKTPQMAHHPLSHYFRTSMCVGPLFPIYVRPMSAGEILPLNLQSLVNTQALLSPLYGTFRLKIMAFFAGTSLYVPKLWRNGSMKNSDGKLDAGYPTFTFKPVSETAVKSTDLLSPLQILSYLGYGSNYFDVTRTTSSHREHNAIPLLMLYDIYRHYFVNRQEDLYYFFQGGSPTMNGASLQALDELFANLPYDGGNINNLISSIGGLGAAINDLSTPLAGFVTGTYLPDRMNVILNSEFYENNVTSVTVSTAGDQFVVDQLVTAKKLWNARNKDSMTNGTFKDWVRVHFGVTPKIMDDMPTFLGATTSNINFEDIRATTYTKDSEGVEQFLGDKASSGLSYSSSRKIVCRADRPGYVMVLAQIVPYVDYYQFTHRYTMSTKLSDEFSPDFNNIGLQDVLVSDLNTDYGSVTDFSGLEDPATVSVGKQPAYTDLITEVNEVRGTFCTTENSWVLTRDMRSLPDDDVDPVYNTNKSAYINPADWNQPFALNSLADQNFLVQFFIDSNVRSTILKRLLPNF